VTSTVKLIPIPLVRGHFLQVISFRLFDYFYNYIPLSYE
jgi:hypothetical protein